MKFYLQNNNYPDLHRIVEKQDYNTFLDVINEGKTDVNQVDKENYNKARFHSVIFSAFHKILYNKEKFYMRRLFALNLSKLHSKLIN